MNVNWSSPELAIRLQEQAIPNRKRPIIIRKAERFVWVCKRRESARLLAEALNVTDGEWNIYPRYPKLVNGEWAGPRWVVMGYGLSPQEMHAIQRIAPKLDPSADGLKWDPLTECYKGRK